jgi:hypothetical protein
MLAQRPVGLAIADDVIYATYGKKDRISYGGSAKLTCFDEDVYTSELSQLRDPEPFAEPFRVLEALHWTYSKGKVHLSDP